MATQRLYVRPVVWSSLINLTNAGTATPFTFRLRLYSKGAHAAGVSFIFDYREIV